MALQITLQTECCKVSDGHMSLVVILPPFLDISPTFGSIFVKEGYAERETKGTVPLLFCSYPRIRKLSVCFFFLLLCCLHTTTIVNKLRSETHSK